MPEAVAVVCHLCGYREDGAEPGKRCPSDGLALVELSEHDAHLDDRFLGRVIASKYPIIGFIGAGTMGAVYRALQEPVGREVAVKVIRPPTDPAPDAQELDQLRERFVREAKIVARLSSPSTVTLHDHGVEPDGTLYMVLEYVRGRLLSKLLHAEGRMPPGRAVALVYQVLQSLAEAHGLGLVHRDLKPANIMVVRGPFGEEMVKVLDFGIARSTSRELGGRIKTQIGTLMGTPRYMSPEQARGEVAEPRSDLYSAGVILYELVNGAAPFVADDPMETILQQLNDPVPPLPGTLRIPPALEAAIRTALEKRADRRFPDAMAMAKALMATRGQVGSSSPTVEKPVADAVPSQSAEAEIADKPTHILAPSDKARVAPLPSQPPKPILLSSPVEAALAPTLPAQPAQVIAEPAADDLAPAPSRRLWPLILLACLCGLGLVALVGFGLMRNRDRAELASATEQIPDPQPEKKPAPLAISPVPDEPAHPSQPDKPVVVTAPVTEKPPVAVEPKPPRPVPVVPRPAPTTGTLDVTCVPKCRVYVDGEYRGLSPVKGLALPPGQHLLWVKDPDSGEKRTQPVEIKAGKRATEVVRF